MCRACLDLMSLSINSPLGVLGHSSTHSGGLGQAYVQISQRVPSGAKGLRMALHGQTPCCVFYRSSLFGAMSFLSSRVGKAKLLEVHPA